MIPQKELHNYAVRQGFWEEPINLAEKLCLIHSEVSEAMEAIRDINPDSSQIAEELADIVIRVADLAEYLRIDLETAISEKYKINLSRPYKHGRRF